MVQEVQVMDYMPSMPESVAASRRIERERSDSSYFFHDVILGTRMILFPVMLLVFLSGAEHLHGIFGRRVSVKESSQQFV